MVLQDYQVTIYITIYVCNGMDMTGVVVVLQDYQVTCCCISVGVLGLVTLVRPITISNIPLIKSFGDWRELDHNDMSSDG